ncbi:MULTISPECIES: class I SAM-dependent rRNA methyltransferase [unclassified Mucilaginibacter]|uniref:class I SAM-dependent rRNA methyltransferase n=1 Tax=unclassified Mucilaginibacter TaxID=2617802 RepID=UPI002AC9BCA7|nr:MULTISPECIES: class I SAM-dependent rRNA methyltransferase [unclassified Mucilaginibacter]MEB0260861.1 class I SAM-dependent rRNA methyltransferase [Mucilaginibacter sp. 10I4]MEB0278451.1 class I SAM-dependent rRNA methyltransferase [Mucilaginibacter sp. 10B2]MEB0303126.1 class I SAM-dependent rRNA methyltransferase [Mucilaginibacter sp. 5C4]WPX24095.1 class I SAM-dependent rRNA methyltransferase [Mucilaginibacter sp. 5C4]
MIDVVLKKGKEKAVLHKHPWVFSGAIENVKGKPANGEIIRLLNSKKDFMAYGFYNDQSRVAVRLLEWDESVAVDDNWFREKVQVAVAGRAHILADGTTDTCRLIFSESDYLPGLIVDKYADHLAVQVLTSGMQNAMPVIIDELNALVKPASIFDKSDATSRSHEGLETTNVLLAGNQPPELVMVKENGISYGINIAEGQKSGFYCDQRYNRQLLATYAKGKTMLDCFSYTGGFTLNAFKNGAISVTSVDSSALALETLEENIRLNKFEGTEHNAIKSDVNAQLRKFREEGAKFDIIVLDPPKYAPSRSALDRASRAYKDLNRLGMQLLNSGGLLATFSCSGAMDMETFKQVLAWAALDAGKQVQFIYQFHQPEDHPVRASFPEGEYLKGLLCRVW